MLKIDGNWVKLLEQRTWVFVALAGFFGALRASIALDLLPYLERFEWLQDAATVGAILFVVLAVGSASNSLLSALKGGWGRRARRKSVIARLSSLSAVEHRILSYLIQANEQAFNYRNDDGDVQQLVGKGLLYTPPGQYSFFMVPFIVPDFVWRELGRRKNEFNSCAPPDEAPWVKNWMAY